MKKKSTFTVEQDIEVTVKTKNGKKGKKKSNLQVFPPKVNLRDYWIEEAKTIVAERELKCQRIEAREADVILNLLTLGYTQASIARFLSRSRPGLNYWIKRHKYS